MVGVQDVPVTEKPPILIKEVFKKSFAGICLVILLLAGCEFSTGSDIDITGVDGLYAMNYRGTLRTFRLHLPKNYSTSQRVPLVIGLHGYSSSSAGFESGSKINDVSDKEGFIAVYPDGLGYPQAWNSGGVFENITYFTDDVGFISAMIDSVSRKYPIDAARIYVTGHSNGASMAYRLAGELSNKITAIAPMAGQPFTVPKIQPVHPVSIIHFHALDDPTVSYQGETIGNSFMLPVDSIAAFWINHNGTAATPDTIFNQNGVVGKKWASATGKGDVIIYTTTRGGHQWLTSENSGISSTDVIWDFFKSR